MEGGGIVVYNGYTSKLCRIDSDFMKSTNEDIVLANHRYPNRDTIYGITIIGEGKYFFFIQKRKFPDS